MPNVFRPSVAAKLLLCVSSIFTVAVVRAQVPTIPTFLSKQLNRVDLGIGGMGEFTNMVSGTNPRGDAMTQRPSTTVGPLINIRYTKSPLVGFEFNYSYLRYTQHFTFIDSSGVPQFYLAGGAQTGANEYTVGYVAHTPKVFGIAPFISVGAGSTSFKGTPNGGQGLPVQARMTYYYTAGAEDAITAHFGLRAEFRQAFFLAPDFGQNYLTIKQRQITTEPAIGFYLHF